MKKIFLIAAAGALCVLLSGCGIVGRFNEMFGRKNYIVDTFEYSAADIDAVEIEWASGSVNIVESDAASLTVTETHSSLSEAQKMSCSIDGRTLKIKFCKSGYVGMFISKTKLLTVEIPRGVSVYAESSSAEIALEAERPADVELHTASGGITAGDFSTESVYINSASGGVSLGKVYSAASIEVYTASGEISADALSAKENVYAESTSGSISVGTLEAAGEASFDNASGGVKVSRVSAPELYIQTASGRIQAGLLSCNDAEISSSSGSVRIELLEDLGATVRCESGSGRFEHGDCYLSGDEYIFGSGACRIEVSTASGGIKIR